MDILERLIEIIPANKIFGSGGDYMFLEGVYGAQESVREAISRCFQKEWLINISLLAKQLILQKKYCTAIQKGFI